MTHIVTAGELLDGHSVLDIECLDRIYLNAYVPVLQSSGQVVAFMTQHLGKPIPSPALMEHIGTRFRRSVESYASGNGIPWVKFGKDDRKIDVMQPHIAAQAATGRSGVAAIGVSQEFQRAWSAYQRDTKAAAPQYTFAKADRRVTCYYFYLWDEDFGPAFIKACAYFPYPAKIWVNGHEWAKRQAIKAGIGFTSCPTGSRPATTRPRCRRSATGCSPAPSRCSPSGGCTACRCPWALPATTPATGGSARCGRSRSRGPWSSTSPAGTGRFSRRSSATTSTSAGRRTWRSSSAGGSAATPPGPSAPPSTAPSSTRTTRA